jgi:sensor domain CHASE-containing protein
LSRQQTLTLFYNMVVEMGYPFEAAEPSFEDADSIADWAYDAIGALQGANIIGGDGANFNPKGNMTRQAAIVAALRFWNALND